MKSNFGPFFKKLITHFLKRGSIYDNSLFRVTY